MTDQEIYNVVSTAVNMVYTMDKLLIDENSHEQTISARIMHYLQNLLPDWHVDVEYSREGAYSGNGERNPKTDSVGVLFRPDIIVHRRGTEDNLVAMEVKGFWNHDRKARIKDRRNLLDLKTRKGYKKIYLIELGREEGEITSQ